MMTLDPYSYMSPPRGSNFFCPILSAVSFLTVLIRPRRERASVIFKNNNNNNDNDRVSGYVDMNHAELDARETKYFMYRVKVNFVFTEKLWKKHDPPDIVILLQLLLVPCIFAVRLY